MKNRVARRFRAFFLCADKSYYPQAIFSFLLESFHYLISIFCYKLCNTYYKVCNMC